MKNLGEFPFKFLLEQAGFEIKGCYEIQNEYWPLHESYKTLRKEHPWYIILTQYGMLKMGPRKKVVELSWDTIDCKVEDCITEENVTGGYQFFHSWNVDQFLNSAKLLADKLSEHYGIYGIYE